MLNSDKTSLYSYYNDYFHNMQYVKEITIVYAVLCRVCVLSVHHYTEKYTYAYVKLQSLLLIRKIRKFQFDPIYMGDPIIHIPYISNKWLICVP